MKNFEFNIIEYFKFSNGDICFGGYMDPPDIGYIRPEYQLQLVTRSNKTQNFKIIGEEIFARSKPIIDRKRVFRTQDDVEELLKNLNHDPVKMIRV